MFQRMFHLKQIDFPCSRPVGNAAFISAANLDFFRKISNKIGLRITPR